MTKTTSRREDHGVTGSETGTPRLGDEEARGRGRQNRGLRPVGPPAPPHTHTCTLFWRFGCFLSCNQTVHKKQEKEEELRPTGTRTSHMCSHSYAHSHGQASTEDTHTPARHHRGPLTHIYTNIPRHTCICRHRGTQWCTHLNTHTSDSIQ